MFEAVDGQVDGAAFRAALTRRRPNDPNILRRYFSQDEQLFTTGAKTYAVTKQWTKTTMEAVMAGLSAKYGSLDLSYRVSEEPGSGV